MAARARRSQLSRAKESHGTRLAVMTVDQVLSGASNVLISVLAARQLDAAHFGQFGVILLLYQILVGVGRALVSDLLLLHPKEAEQRPGDAIGSGLVVAIGEALVLAIVGLATRQLNQSLGDAMVLLAAALPLLMVQDVGRFLGFATRRPTRAAVLDTLWLVLMLAGVAVLVARHSHSLAWMVVAWGGSGAVSALLVFAWCSPRAVRLWSGRLQETWGLGWRYLIMYGTAQASALGLVGEVGGIAGGRALGGVQGSLLLVRPFTTCQVAVITSYTGEVARVLGDRSAIWKLARSGSLVTVGVAAVNAAVMLALPYSVGHAILGASWRPAHALLVPTTVEIVGMAALAGPAAALVGLRSMNSALTLNVVTTVLMLGGAAVGAEINGAVGAIWFVAAVQGALAVGWWLALGLRLRKSALPAVSQAPEMAVEALQAAAPASIPGAVQAAVPAAVPPAAGRDSGNAPPIRPKAHIRPADRLPSNAERRSRRPVSGDPGRPAVDLRPAGAPASRAMKTETRELTLTNYLEVVRRHKLLILVITVLIGAAGFGLSAVQKKKYAATSSLQASDPNQQLQYSTGYVSTSTPLQLASQQAPQVDRPEVLALVQRKLGKRFTADLLRSSITVTIDANSYLINIRAQSRNPHTAANIANAFANADAQLTNTESRAQYAVRAKQLRHQLRAEEKSKNSNAQLLAEQTESSLARVVQLVTLAQPLTVQAPASVPGSPFSPKPVKDTVAGVIIGLFLGIAAAIIRDMRDRRLRHVRDVTDAIDSAVLGRIRSTALGHTHAEGAREGLALSDPDQESFRILSQNVRATRMEGRIILVTSPMAAEGKSTVASGLACAMAEAGLRTLLVDCDLRRPVQGDRFGLPPTPGLTDYLLGEADPSEILREVSVDEERPSANGAAPAPELGGPANLVCITAGTPSKRPAELLASEQFAEFLNEVGSVYDIVVLDTAPLLPVADTMGMLPDASTVLLCVRLMQTTRDQLRSAVDTLERHGPQTAGVVVTDLKGHEDGYYGYDAYYGYSPTERTDSATTVA